MDNFLMNKISIGKKIETPFQQKLGIYQDGTTAMYRDVDGKLWAVTGHTNGGHIGVFCGTCLDDLAEVHVAYFNFVVGHADYAFDGVRYPGGIKARGSVWPFGLYICPVTHRFFVFFHNETGWFGRGTAYDSFGLCETPKLDSDFRHIGLMHSDDEGASWTFDRWVMSGEEPCFTDRYNPAGDIAIGQKHPKIALGTGDFSLYVDPAEDGYLYLFYNNVHIDTEADRWESCNVYVARSRKRRDGIMGDFVKYYNGVFCEPGNCGKESPIVPNAWHAGVVWSEKYGKYIMTSTAFDPANEEPPYFVATTMEVRVSDDMLHWSEPVRVYRDGELFGNHYVKIVPDDTASQPNLITGDTFSIL
ncbi:MAG: hypothetical protein IJD10_07765, partial [Clostridia bacterium]|nr:hypothetical protein [Clostridia bacterium]